MRRDKRSMLALIEQLTLERKTARQIAEYLGMSARTVEGWRIKLRIKKPKLRRKSLVNDGGFAPRFGEGEAG